MRSYRRRLFGAIGAAALVVGLAPAGVAHAAAPTPAFFPVGDTLNTTAYSLRMAGNNRFSTAATTALTAVSDDDDNTGYPFGNPDHTGATGSQFGGAGCPDAIFFSAGDTPADALAASAFFESGSYSLPLVGGGSGTIDTSDAVMLLTESARNGATDLSGEAIAAIARIKNICSTPDAIVFGGPAAVPNGAVSTIDQLLGQTSVIAGVDRFDTAKRIALQLGTGTATYYPTATSGNTGLNNAVILAEARTGADALSVGPFAAWLNIPIILTDTASLSPFSATTLSGLAPSNIIVAGGPNAISDAVVTAAKGQAGPGSVATRIFDADRYGTSIMMAKQLFGYYPDNAGGNAFNDLTVGLARSEGVGAAHVGWPDALTSAEFLAGIKFESSAPTRSAPGIEKNHTEGGPFVGIGGNGNSGPNGGWATPLLLTPQGGLANSVSSYLGGLYPDATVIRTATTPGATNSGGFAFTFGGTSAVSSGAELAAAGLLSGGTYVAATQSDIAPTMDAASTFFTQLDWTGFTNAAGGGLSNSNGDAINGSPATEPKVCALRNALTGSEYLANYNPNGTFDSSELVYYEPTGGAYTPFQSRFQCIDDQSTADGTAIVNGVSLSGHETAAKTFDYSAAAKLLQTGAAGADPVVDAHTGDPSAATTTSSSTSQTYSGVMNVTYKGVTTPNAPFVLTLNYTRTDGPGAVTQDTETFTGTLTVGGGTPIFTATLKGEVLQANVDTGAGATFHLAGMYTAGTGQGGFQAVIDNTSPDVAPLTGLVVDGLA